MGEGNLKELRELVEFLKASGVAEFDMERPELKVHLTFAGAAPSAAPESSGIDIAQLARLMASSGVAPAAPPAATTTAPGASAIPAAAAAPSIEIDEEAGLHIVKSPLVGTFYEAPSPGAEPFVKVGDTVSVGKVICIVEAMKIMNEIECDAAGEVVKIYARAGQPVEYGQKLFGIRA